MEPIYNVRDALAPNLIIIAHLFTVIIALCLVIQLVATLVTIAKILVLGPVWIVIRALIIVLKLLKLVVVVLAWSVCSVFRGVIVLLTVFGFPGRRYLRVEPGGGNGDGQLLATRRQEANLASVRDTGMAGRGGHEGQVYILFPGGPVRGGNNVGIGVGGMDVDPGAWQADALWRDRLINMERHLARERARYEGRL